MKRALLLLLPLGLVAAAVSEGPRLVSPLPFSHASHERAFRVTHVACIDCHPIGRTSDPPTLDLPTPTSTCHACHLREIKGVPHGAPNQCGLCHADRGELIPESHSPGWRVDHVVAARADARGCASCHASRECYACHDGRGPIATNPHGPGFRTTHGIEARLDPARCSTCHTGESCTSCHATGSMPW
ncbi:MAG: hypothetical protein ABIO70_04975 [Pseudomonadota bacterium]